MNLVATPIALMVALCWMSHGTYAQNSTVAPSSSNVTTPSSMNATSHSPTMASNVTAAVTTPVASNVTVAVTTPVASNVTAAVTTPVASNVTVAVTTPVASNVTVAVTTPVASNVTVAVTTSVASNVTAAVTTPVASNVTAAVTTPVASNVTAAVTTSVASNVTAAVTTPAPFVINTTVETLSTNLSRSGCGTERLCAAEPSDCDPVAGSCFYTSTKSRGGFNHDFELAGESDGYLACALEPSNGGKQTVYVCINKGNGKVTFRSVSLLNGVFTNLTTPVTNVKGKVTGNRIQCQFSATIPNATSTSRATDSSYSLGVLTGSVGASGDLGSPKTQVKTAALDLTIPAGDTTNTVTTTTTTTAPTTSTTAGTAPLQSLSHALLVVFAVLSLSWL